MKVVNSSDISGVIIKRMKRHEDSRGWLAECFRHDEINQELWPVMAYVSATLPEIARGPHEHEHQTDYFCFLGTSSFRLFLWDNRKNSPTYLCRTTIHIHEDEILVAIIPPGVVHAYKNIGTAAGYVVNCPNKLFAGHGKSEKIDETRYENKLDTPFRIEEKQ